MSTQVLELNVGGCLFTTTRATLCRESNSMLAKMFAEDSDLPPAYRDSQGRFFIDRDGTYFNIILSYLRGQSFVPPDNTIGRKALAEEAQFYQLTGFVDHIALQQESPNESANPGKSLDMLATMSYEEAHAALIAHARHLLGHDRVQQICNAMVKQYFDGHGLTEQYGSRIAIGPLFRLHERYKNYNPVWQPSSKSFIDVPKMSEGDLVAVVSANAGLFKHDLALRGFGLEFIHNLAGIGGLKILPL